MQTIMLYRPSGQVLDVNSEINVLEQHWEFYFNRMVETEDPSFYIRKLNEIDERIKRLCVLLDKLGAN